MSDLRKAYLTHRRPVFSIFIAMVLILTSFASVTANMAGSNFDTDDGNIKVDDETLDWANVNEIRKQDTPSGQADDSFTQGTKEDTVAPVKEFGSIPPNKSDLKFFGVYQEENAGGKFLHMYWTRVQDPSGTTNMDFEFNKNKCDPADPAGSVCSPNGTTPDRTSGDLLIVYELARGGTSPHLFLLEWLTGGEGYTCDASNAFPCWGNRIDLSGGGDATGSINTVAIPAGEADGLGALDARTFGEATVNLDAIFEAGKCESFGSVYLKSRSSDSFTAALKDFIAPEPVNITNCGSVVIRKQTIPDEDPNSTVFGYTKSFGTDPTSVNTFTLMDDGSKTFSGVLFGSGYTVDEDVVPAGWALDSVDCSASVGVTPSIVGGVVTFNIDNASDVLDCTYTNKQITGAIKIVKTYKSAANGGSGLPQAGVDFAISGGDLASDINLTTDANGTACVDGLVLSDYVGGYVVTESVPAGYVSDDAVKEVSVSAVGVCGDGNEAVVSFDNTPLTDITVSVNSQVNGGTASTIECVLSSDSSVVASGSTGANGDGSVTATGLLPGTYVCTVVVDP